MGSPLTSDFYFGKMEPGLDYLFKSQSFLSYVLSKNSTSHEIGEPVDQQF
jgi:hypothetical protein